MTLTQLRWYQGECSELDLKPHFIRRDELSVEQDCLMWGMRVIIPPNRRELVLNKLNWVYPGVASMKSMAQSYVWWPKLNADLEKTACECSQCIKTRNALRLGMHCLLDLSFHGPGLPVPGKEFTLKHYLIPVDAHFKWPEVIGPLRSTNAASTVSALSNLFTRYGFPELVVSGSGPPIQSRECANFLLKPEWKMTSACVTLPPYC